MIIKNKGIALIAAIMLIVFVSIIVLGLSTFIVQWYKQIDVEERRARCIYNAMAGVHYSLYQYRNDATLVDSPPSIDIDDNNNFTLSTVSIGGSGAAANLIIDATAAYLSSSRKDVLGITLTNTSLTTAITLSQMVIYIDTGTRTLDRVDINGSSVWTANTLIGTIPITLDMTDVIIPANTMITVDTIRWVSSISATTVHWGFIMSDASAASTCTVYPAPASSCSGSLTIQSMGKTTGSNQYRSVQAAYNTSTGNISDYDEIAQTVP